MSDREPKPSVTDLLLLMSVLAQAFFTLVRRHLVTFVFLTVWHIQLNLRDITN